MARTGDLRAAGKRSASERDLALKRLAGGNQLLKLVPRSIFDDLKPSFELVELKAGETVFEAGDDVRYSHFPLNGAVFSLVLPMQDGRAVDAATVGREGALGGVVSLGIKPAFARAVVQMPGQALRLPIGRLEAVKRSSPKLHDLLIRYADCLTALTLQSVGCATIHSLEARCARWLLMSHDRMRQPELSLTQEALAEMFGVTRTYVSKIAMQLQSEGAISYRRGTIRIEKRHILEGAACECYGTVRKHFERVLPGLYPRMDNNS